LGWPAMGRKVDVAVARAKAREVGVMVAGWGRSGLFLVVFWWSDGKIGDNVVNVCRRETNVCA